MQNFAFSFVRGLVAVVTLLAADATAGAAEKLVYMNDWLPGGDKALPFYEWLSKQNGGPVHWNYTKFFIDKAGKVVARFDPAVTPDSVEMQAAVLAILAGTYKAPGTGDAAPSGRRGGGGGMMPPPMN